MAMVWLKKEEAEDIEMLCRLAERLKDYANREYDDTLLLGAAPTFMANDRRVVMLDLARIRNLANSLLTGMQADAAEEEE